METNCTILQDASQDATGMFHLARSSDKRMRTSEELWYQPQLAGKLRERGNFPRVCGELCKNRPACWSGLDLNFRDPSSLRWIFDCRAGSVMGAGLGIPRKPEVTVV